MARPEHSYIVRVAQNTFLWDTGLTTTSLIIFGIQTHSYHFCFFHVCVLRWICNLVNITPVFLYFDPLDVSHQIFMPACNFVIMYVYLIKKKKT